MGTLKAKQNSQRAPLITNYTETLGTMLIRHRSEVAMNAARVEAERISRAKSDFIAHMSHELRTPLNAILGFAELMAPDNAIQIEPEKTSEYSGYIHESAKKLLAIVNDILEISKLQGGAVEIEPVEADLHEIIESSFVAEREHAKEVGVPLINAVEKGQCIALVDRMKARQAICAMLSNAIKFSKPGGDVKISAEFESAAWIAITITDQGIGMTADEIEIALKPFGQVDSGLNRQFEGSGLGLPIANALIELHGGTLEVKSQKDEGSTVTLTVPNAHAKTMPLHTGNIIEEDEAAALIQAAIA